MWYSIMETVIRAIAFLLIIYWKKEVFEIFDLLEIK